MPEKLRQVTYAIDKAEAAVLAARMGARRDSGSLAQAASSLSRAREAILRADDEGRTESLQQVADALDTATKNILEAKGEARQSGYISPLGAADLALTAETLTAVGDAGDRLLDVIHDLQRFAAGPGA
jgi:vacuolar-type H+-ATPase subunit H